MMRRLFAMLGLIVSAILATIFVPDRRQVALINLGMITPGFFVATNYLRSTAGVRPPRFAGC